METIRAKLAAELTSAEGKDAAPIARALLEVMREIHGGAKPAVSEQPEKVGGIADLTARIAAKRAGTAG